MNNKETFFSLLRAGLWEKEVRFSPFETIDFGEVYRLAEEQSVVGIVAAGLEHVKDYRIPQKKMLIFAGRTLQLEQHNLAMNHFIERLAKRLNTAGVKFLLVKGQGVAQNYERPLWRTCGDVDLFLDDANYAIAREALLPFAMHVEHGGTNSKQLEMTIDGWIIELHSTLRCSLSRRISNFYDNASIDILYDSNVRVWKNGNTNVFLPNAEYDVVYVFTHFLNHFYKGGIGLRQICDWCRLLWIYHSTIDNNLLETRLRTMGLVTEWKAFGAFAVEYLGMPCEAMPLYTSESKWRLKAKKIGNFIIRVGNFGHNRDMSYYGKYPYLIRKVISFKRRMVDLINHACIFPFDTLRFFPQIMYVGFLSVAKRE